MEKTANESQAQSISAVGTTRRTGKKGPAITSFGVLMLGVLGITIYMYFTFTTVLVKGRSMFPTFKTNNRVLVCKAYWLVGPIHDGDVVVVKDPNPDGYIIKRIHKMAGEAVDWKYIPDSYPIAQLPYRVPEGMVYLLGDNRPESEDSRRFGPRKVEDVLGKVIKKP